MAEEGVHLLDYVFPMKGEKVLLEKRLHPDFLRGRWSLPWDLLQYGEHPDQSVERIVREQLGVGLRRQRLVTILSYTQAHEMIPHLPPHWDLSFIHEVELDGEPEFDSELISGVEFHPFVDPSPDLVEFQTYILDNTKHLLT